MANFFHDTTATEIFTAKATSTINKGDALKFTTGGVTTAGDGDQVDAFAAEAGTSGDYITVQRGRMHVVGRAATGVDLAVGDDVYLDATQELDAGSTGNTSLGTVVGEDPESGGLVTFEFDPLGSTVHA